ncbi:MAG: hypothetical protein NC548_58360, partial [Lachnospiraceae bacterium]|nr:hypothetical protein [Lachnospiraceae bacterium]
KLKNKANKLKKQLHFRYAPRALSLLFVASPAMQVQPSPQQSPNEEITHSISLNVTQANTDELLALAQPGTEKAFDKSLAYASIATESLGVDPKNPAAVATGNGYFGQHQFGGSAASDFMVKKYIAYALINGSEEFKQSLKNNLMAGSEANKNKLIQNFISSLGKYDEKGKPEQAFNKANPAYKALAANISVTPAAFKKAHKDFPEEGNLQQKMCVFDLYMHLISRPIQEITKLHPRINMAKIHPAIMGSVVAIAVKQGNGRKFNQALYDVEKKANQDFCTAKQKEINESYKDSASNKKPPLAVSCQKGEILPENIVAQNIEGRTVLTVYDPSGKIKEDDIAAAKEVNGANKIRNTEIRVKKAERPKGVKSSREVQVYDLSHSSLDVNKYINTDEWLKNYCGKQFRKVYNVSAPDLDKVPTVDSYYEMSVILRDPELYKQVENMMKKMTEPKHNYAYEAPAGNEDIPMLTDVLQSHGKSSVTAAREKLALHQAAKEKKSSKKIDPQLLNKMKDNYFRS